MWLILGLIVACVLLYRYWTSSFSTWKDLNVPHDEPHFLFGSLKDVVYQKLTFFQAYQNIYKKFPHLPYVGIYVINRPGILIRDPALVKEVVVNSFPSFHDNDLMVDENVDPIFGQNPFTNKGDAWKTRRSLHSVQFSSGKIKYMYTLMGQGGDRMNRFLNDEIKQNQKCTILAMELAAKYTIYNVANCSMGFDPKTFEDDNAEMRQMGRQIMEPNLYNGVKQLLIFIMPSLSNFLTVRLIPTDVTNRFRRLAREILQYRKENGIKLNDFFDNIQEHKGEKSTIDEIIGQTGGLFLDGFGTNATSLNFTLYELAANVDVQIRLREEIDEVTEKYKGDIPYEIFQEMPYLDAVVSEGLRKYPPLASMSKLATKEFTFPPATESANSVTVQPHTPIIIPTFAIHYDEKYFPDPQRFDPTRFYGDNKQRIVPFTYFPFNEGPRTCLGKRFALVQSKLMLLKLVQEFEFRINPKTVTPIKFDVNSFLLAAEGGIWLDIYKRKR